MKKVLVLVCLLAATPAWACDHVTRLYGTQTTVDFCLFVTDATVGAVKVESATHASGDTYIMKDEGAEANTTNGFTDEGSCYSIVLTNTEMQAARVVLNIEDQSTKTWADACVVIETYGNASAQHTVPNVNVETITDGAIAAADFASGAITATVIAADAIGASEIADSAIDAGAIATDAITSAKIATDAIGAAEIAADAVGASELATDAIGAAELAADAIASSELATTAVDEIWTATVVQLASAPGTGTLSVSTMLRAVFQRFFHKFDDNGTEQAGYAADGSTKRFEMDLSDDGSTYTKGANGTPD